MVVAKLIDKFTPVSEVRAADFAYLNSLGYLQSWKDYPLAGTTNADAMLGKIQRICMSHVMRLEMTRRKHDPNNAIWDVAHTQM